MKDNTNILLCEAYNSFKKKRYAEAIVLLEKVDLDASHSVYVNLLLATSYLLQDRFNDTQSMLKRIRFLEPDYLPYIQLESFLLLKSSPDSKAILSVYIDRLREYPADKYILRAIRKLRNIKDFKAFQKKARLNDFVYIPSPSGIIGFRSRIRTLSTKKQLSANRPSESFGNYNNDNSGKNYKNKKIKKTLSAGNSTQGRASNPGFKFPFIFFRSASLVLVIIAGFAAILYFGYGFIPLASSFFAAKEQVHSIDNVNLDIIRYDLIDKIKRTKPRVFYYSSDVLLHDFNRAKKLIKKEKYNRALILINKISNSNANFRVRDRIDFLRKFITGIEYRSYEEIPVSEIMNKPYLYRGVFIKCKGKIANLKKTSEKQVFNLLVDYKANHIFSGVIDVLSEKDLKLLNNGDFVAIDAVFLRSFDKNNRIYLLANKISLL